MTDAYGHYDAADLGLPSAANNANQPYTEADVQRYARVIVGIPGMDPHPDDLAAARAVLEALARDGRLRPSA